MCGAFCSLDDFTTGDGVRTSPRELYAYLTRVMYERRNKGDPLWNSMLLAGADFLGFVDLQGTAFEETQIATGYGRHLALPLLRNAYRADLSAADARRVLEDAMRVLYYRDCRTINRIQFANITAHGVTIEEPVELATQWGFLEDVQHGSEGTW